MSSDVFNAMPGMAMPVSGVVSALSSMWQSDSALNRANPTARASQMNVILHFGLSTTPEDAQKQFRTAIAFAQRYPCRVIVLCPESQVSAREKKPMQAKLFSQCYLGKTLRHQCYCEALILSYPRKETQFLEDQVSIWLEGDLPLYYWFHRVSPDSITEEYLIFLNSCRKIVYDSAVEPEDYKDIPWPKSYIVADLVNSRILPVRQLIGQFFGAYKSSLLVDQLTAVSASHSSGMQAEAGRLLEWMQRCIGKCGANGSNIHFDCTASKSDGHSEALSVEWAYQGKDKFFTWKYDLERQMSKIEANIDGKPIALAQSLQFLPSDVALAEAFFF